MTFKEFLIKYDIPFKIDEKENILIDDNLLIPYEEEIRKIIPKFEFIWDYRRYRNEPTHRSLDI